MGKPIRIPMAGLLTNRTGATTKDARIKNAYLEKADTFGQEDVSASPSTNLALVKRPGLTLRASSPDGAAEGYALATIPGTVVTLYWIGGKIYKDDGTSTLVAVNSDAADNNYYSHVVTSSRPAFYEHQTTSGTQYLIAHQGLGGFGAGNKMAVYTGATPTETLVTDADFTGGSVCYPLVASLDGYIFTGRRATCDIQNSDLNSITAWTAGSTLGAYGHPGTLKGIFRHHNYIAALKEASLEFFYDAANAAGSPLAKVDGNDLYWGSKYPLTFWNFHDTPMWVSNGPSGSYEVVILKGLVVAKFSTPWVEKIIETIDTETSTAAAIGTDAMRAVGMTYQGHKLYLLHIPTQSQSLVFDFLTNHWYVWTSEISNVEGFFEVGGAISRTDASLSAASSPTYRRGCKILHASNGNVYDFDPAVYQDYAN